MGKLEETMKEDPVEREIEEWTGHRRTITEQAWGGLLAFIATVAMAGVLLWISFTRTEGAECKLAWNPNPETNITGYQITLGIIPLATTAGTTATVILPNAPCEIAIRAVNSGGLCSLPSTLKLSYVDTADRGDSLLSFRYLPGRHVVFWPGRRFYSTRIQNPP